MNFLETHDLAISTLSPVHVGCGEDYEPTNYVIADDTLFAFNPARVLAALEPGQREELARALDERNPLLAAQKFFFRHKDRAVELAAHRAPVAPAAARFYAQRVGTVANRQQGGGQVINKLEIARTAFNPVSGLPILPGSSLKGAMRTAVVEAMRQQTGRRYPITDQEAGRNNDAARKAKDMERDVLGGGFQTDPLRLVKVADAPFRPGKVRNMRTGEETPKLARSILFQANRKKRPNQFAACGNIETLVECIPAGQHRAFHGQLTIEYKAGPNEQTPMHQIDWPLLAKACNDFYRAHFERELAMLEKNGYVSAIWAGNARKRLAPDGPWGKTIAAGHGFLLRVGRHSGAENVTVDAPRKIKIMKGREQPVDWDMEATTVWLAANEPGAGRDMHPFGWVFVELTNGL